MFFSYTLSQPKEYIQLGVVSAEEKKGDLYLSTFFYA